MDREAEVGGADNKGEKVQEGDSEEGGKSQEQQQEESTKSVPAEEKKKAPPAKSGKVEVRLQAAGDAPIMKQKNYKVREIFTRPKHTLLIVSSAESSLQPIQLKR